MEVGYMKIGVTLSEYYKNKQGGAEIQISLLINFFLRNGHDVFYICQGDKNIIKPKVEENGLRLYQIKNPLRGYRFLLKLNKKKIYNILDREKPDIIYQRGNFNYWDLITRYGRLKGVPIVSGLSNERHCKKIKPRFGIYFLQDFLREKMKVKYYNNSTLIISQTEYQKRMMKKEFGLNSIVIPNGHPVPDGPFKKKMPSCAIWVANIKPIKRPEMFIEITKQLDGLGYRFIMIGRPNKGKYQEKINSFINEVKDLEYLGELPLKETNEYISTSHVLVNTSKSEGFSNTFIQAWLRETPVVTLSSDPDGIIGREGLGRKSGNMEKCIIDVEDLLKDQEMVEKIGSKGRKYAVDNFDIENIGMIYLEKFEELIR